MEKRGLTKAMEFKKFIDLLFERAKILVKEEYRVNDYYYCDYFINNDTIVEFKYSSYLDNRYVDEFINNIKERCLNNNILIIINIPMDEESKKKFTNVEILSLENLLYLCNNDETLKSTLINSLTFSTEQIFPQKPSKKVLELLGGNFNVDDNKIDENKFFYKLNTIVPGKTGSTKYENFCEEFIKTVFSDYITNIKGQKKNNRDLYRFDIIASLKTNLKSFWKLIYDKYNSNFILFECKNHSEKIGQDEIYTTERYLYNNALRNVAIIFSRKGINSNGNIARQGILKEHGKLIIVLDDEDLIKLERIYNDYQFDKSLPSPSDYLLDKVMEFLMDLDK